MSDPAPAADRSLNLLDRREFARVLADPKIFGTAFLPPERADWRGESYTLGNALAKTPKGLFTGVRLQAADRRNIDQSRERSVQQDLGNLVRSVTYLRANPALAGVVLSQEMLQGRDPSGVRRVRFGLFRSASGVFLDDKVAAGECHDRLVRAIHGAGLRVAVAPDFDMSQGFGGLQIWASSVKLRQSKLASAAAWGKVCAILGAVGIAAWMVPPLANGISSRFNAMREYLLPKLAEVRSVEASDGTFTDKVEIEWPLVQKATGYSIYRDDMSSPIARVDGKTVHYEDFIAPVGQRVKYAIKATTLLTSGELGQTDDGFRNVHAPDGVRASDGSQTDCIDVTWNPTEHATGYDVFRETDGQQPEWVCSTAEASCKDTKAPSGVDCKYTIKAKTAAALSAASSPPAIGIRCPPMPEGLAATDGTDTTGVNLRWNPVQGAESYELDRTCPDGTCQPADPIRCRGTSYSDTSADPGLTYAYSVKAVCPRKTSAASDPDEGWRGFVLPTVKASDGDFADRVHLAWNAVPSAQGYEILRDNTQQVLGATDGNESTTFDDLSAQPHVKHSYRVKALTVRKDTPAGDADEGWRSLPAPDNVKASRGDTEKVVIEWQTVPGANKYKVVRDEKMIHTTSGVGDSRFEDQNAEIGTLYSYAVASVSDSTGSGPLSDAVDGYRNLKPPLDVAAVADGNSIVVNWKAVEGATRYEIFRSDQEKDPVGFARGNASVSWTDRQVPPGEFTYSVKARTDTVTGRPSDPSQPISLTDTRDPDVATPAPEAADGL